MKTLDYHLKLSGSNTNSNNYYSLIQTDIAGGKITRDKIDTIISKPLANSISISGLTQDTFEYFIYKYAKQFIGIYFWKCPLISDFTPLESLPNIEYIIYYWNHRASKFWNFSKTSKLKGLSFQNCNKLDDLSELSNFLNLVELNFGDMLFTKYVLKSLQPLSNLLNLKRLTFRAKSILDNKIEPIANLKNLEILSFPSNLFKTEQIAWLKAKLPGTVHSRELNSYIKLDNPLRVIDNRNKVLFIGKNIVISGKGKPSLDFEKDANRIKKYDMIFNQMLEWFSNNPSASPEDYKYH